MIIYGVAGSQPVHAVLALLYRHKDIPFKFELRVPGSTKAPRGAQTPEYLKISPSGTVPAMDDDGLVMCESAAIMQHICEKNGLKEYPEEPRTRARVNEYLHWHHHNTRRIAFICAAYFRPGLNVKIRNKQEVEEIVKPIVTTIESMLADKMYLTSGELTIADLQCFMEVHQLETCNLYSLDEFPKTKAWVERMSKDAGIQEVLNSKSAQQMYEMLRQARAKL